MNIFPENASTYGGEIDNLFWLIFAFVAIAFVISIIVLFYPLFRYNSKNAPKAEYITGEKKKHFKWVTIALVLLAMSDFVILVVEHGTWDKIEMNPPTDGIRVGITGIQWNWVFTYPGPDGKLNTSDDVVVNELSSELHVPVNTNIIMELRSRDVIHDVFIPNARTKQDVLPGRTNVRWVNFTKEGKYEIVCSQICGVLHSKMRNYFVVESKEKYDAYIKDLYAKHAPKADTATTVQNITDTTKAKDVHADPTKAK